jgi:putative FmdB family regulatory protein
VPIYVFKCSACSKTQEQILKIDEKPEPCEECGAASSKLEKQVTNCTTRFERSIGWDGWERMGPGMVGRTVDPSKHIEDGGEKNPGSRKAV